MTVVEETNRIKSYHAKVGGMQCSFCVESIKKAFSRINGVENVAVNLSHEEILIKYNIDKVKEETFDKTLRSLGYSVRDPKKILSFEEEQKELSLLRKQLFISTAITFFSLIFMIFMWSGFKLFWFKWVMFFLAFIMIFIVGWPILKMAFASLRRRILNQHVLMEFGAFGGLIGGFLGFVFNDWPTADFLGSAIFITTYHILSGYVSLLVRTKSSKAIMKLMDLQPHKARVILNGSEKFVRIEKVNPGDLVSVKPGESIPVDGKIVKGTSSVNQSLVTGESIPVVKKEGDEVIGGSINQNGHLVIKVTKIGEESFLQQIVKSVQEARALKPGILQFVEKVLKYFVPGVLSIALISLLTWTLGNWLILGYPNFERAAFATLAVLVLGYPCALGMATPLAIIRGGGVAAEKGILIRSGEAFQIFKEISVIVLDKTGTITIGKPTVVRVKTYNTISEHLLLNIAYSIEKNSEHPLANAIVNHVEKEKISNNPFQVEEFQSIAGLGVKATIDQKYVIIGSPIFLRNEKVDLSIAEDDLNSMENRGWTVVGVARERELIGLIAIADTIKPDAKQAIKRMKNEGFRTILLTGDNRKTALSIAKQLGIEEVEAEVLPQEKAEKIRSLQKNRTRVVMVGDGINDAPALMQADIGIAFNKGTDIAIESADIILVNNNLSSIIDAYYISKSSFRKTKQNVALAFSFNGIGILSAITGFVHPIFAMVAMVASVSTVLLNSYIGKLVPILKERRKLNNKKDKRRRTVKLFIPSIKCGGCINNLSKAIDKVSKVKKISGDSSKKILVVEIYSKKENIEKSIEKIKSKIREKGHEQIEIEYL